jgi:hypothetical protein
VVLSAAPASCLFLPPARSSRALAAERDGEAVANLTKRVARLEAEVTRMRKALGFAGGGAVDRDTEIRNFKAVARLRSADLLQRTRNMQTLLRGIVNGRFAGPALQSRINDLNNDLAALWMKLASYGLGGEPYLDHIQVSDSGSGRADRPPDHGIPGPWTASGFPRLHERFLELSGVKDKAARQKQAEVEKLVKAYSNPAVYQHRDFGERAYKDYREGKGLGTAQYAADLKTVDGWLRDLEKVLEKLPGFFKAP